MNVPFREKKALTVAGTVAVTAVALVYIVFPLARTWSEWGSQLDPKLAQVAQLREQVRGYEALVARRDALAKRLGSLRGRPPETGPKSGDAAGTPGEAKSPAGSASPVSEVKQRENSPAGSSAAKTGEAASSTPTTSAPTAGLTSGALKETPAPAKPAESGSDKAMAASVPAAEKSAGESGSVTTPPVPAVLTSAEGTSAKAPAGTDSSPTDKPAAPKDGPVQNKPTESGDKAPASSIAANGAGDAKAGPDRTKVTGSVVDKGAPVPGNERLAAYFERSASQAGVKIKRVSSKKGGSGSRAGRYFTPVTLQLSVEGKAENLVKLLYAVEKGDRFARVQQMELHRDTAKGNAIDASLDILGYE